MRLPRCHGERKSIGALATRCQRSRARASHVAECGPMNFPLQLSFKIVAIAPQFSVRDAGGNLLFYVRQKLFKLKEAITVFGDEAQTRPVFTIKADRVIDFSARYDIADTSGRYVGSVKRHGMRSLWRTHYEVYDGN